MEHRNAPLTRTGRLRLVRLVVEGGFTFAASAPDRGEVFRHEWPCPGDLLQMDVKRFARFTSPGHAVTGDRTRSATDRRERVGYEFATR